MGTRRGWEKERWKKWSEERKEGNISFYNCRCFIQLNQSVWGSSINHLFIVSLIVIEWNTNHDSSSSFRSIQGLLRITVQSLGSFGGNRRLLFPNKARTSSGSNRSRRLWLNRWSTGIKFKKFEKNQQWKLLTSRFSFISFNDFMVTFSAKQVPKVSRADSSQSKSMTW